MMFNELGAYDTCYDELNYALTGERIIQQG